MKMIDIITIVVSCSVSGLVGFGINEKINSIEVGYAPIELTKEDLNSKEELVQPLIPMNIKLRILSDEDFNTESIKFFGQKVGAFTQIGSNNRECSITIPAGMSNIRYVPKQDFSTYFDNGNTANIAVTHELLHCIRGHWHGQR